MMAGRVGLQPHGRAARIVQEAGLETPANRRRRRRRDDDKAAKTERTNKNKTNQKLIEGC
jgi:hypothetical protein